MCSGLAPKGPTAAVPTPGGPSGPMRRPVRPPRSVTGPERAAGGTTTPSGQHAQDRVLPAQVHPPPPRVWGTAAPRVEGSRVQAMRLPPPQGCNRTADDHRWTASTRSHRGPLRPPPPSSNTPPPPPSARHRHPSCWGGTCVGDAEGDGGPGGHGLCHPLRSSPLARLSTPTDPQPPPKTRLDRRPGALRSPLTSPSKSWSHPHPLKMPFLPCLGIRAPFDSSAPLGGEGRGGEGRGGRASPPPPPRDPPPPPKKIGPNFLAGLRRK